MSGACRVEHETVYLFRDKLESVDARRLDKCPRQFILKLNFVEIPSAQRGDQCATTSDQRKTTSTKTAIIHLRNGFHEKPKKFDFVFFFFAGRR